MRARFPCIAHSLAVQFQNICASMLFSVLYCGWCKCVCVFSSLSFLTKSVNTPMALDSSTMQLQRLIEITQCSSSYESIVGLFLASICVLIHFNFQTNECHVFRFCFTQLQRDRIFSLTFLNKKQDFNSINQIVPHFMLSFCCIKYSELKEKIQKNHKITWSMANFWILLYIFFFLHSFGYT